MVYPNKFDYACALSEGDCFNSLYLQMADTFEEAVNSNVGTFSHVFKVYDQDGNMFAMKCFTGCPTIDKRYYQSFEKTIAKLNSPYHPKSFRFINNEIEVLNSETCMTESYPVILTDWFDGEPLDAFVAHHRNDEEILDRLYHNFCEMAVYLRSIRFTHGRISPKCILVDNKCHLRLTGLDFTVNDYSLSAVALALRLVFTCSKIPFEKLNFLSGDVIPLMPDTAVGQYVITHSDDVQIAKLHTLLLIAYCKGCLSSLPPEIFSPSYPFDLNIDFK